MNLVEKSELLELYHNYIIILHASCVSGLGHGTSAGLLFYKQNFENGNNPSLYLYSFHVPILVLTLSSWLTSSFPH